MRKTTFTLLALTPVIELWRTHTGRWQRARIPEGAHILNARSVFILPTWQGVYVAFFLLAMLLGCINYNLSLGYMLTFFVFAVTLGAMSRTHQNLLGLKCELEVVQAHQTPIFAGSTARIPLLLSNTSRLSKLAITLTLKRKGNVLANQARESHKTYALAAGETRTFALALHCPVRGLHPVPAFVLASDYPLGLWRAWSYVFHPDAATHAVWVYPAPCTPLPRLSYLSNEPNQSPPTNTLYASPGHHGDAVSHLEATDAVSLRRIHWPSLAKGQIAQRVLDSDTQVAQHVRLGFDGCTVRGLEAQLSQLCAGVLHCYAQGIAFTLQLDEQTTPADGSARNDSAHLEACLQRLACYE